MQPDKEHEYKLKKVFQDKHIYSKLKCKAFTYYKVNYWKKNKANEINID